MQAKGRPILGAISGLFFGLGLALFLQAAGVQPLDSLSLFGLPAIGLALGLVLAFTAPFGGSGEQLPPAVPPAIQGGPPPPTEGGGQPPPPLGT